MGSRQLLQASISSDRPLPALIVTATTFISILGCGSLPPFSLQEEMTLRGPLAELVVPSANADFRAAQKRTYFRYIPRFTEGLNYFKDLKPALEREDYAAAEKMFDVYVTRYNPNDPKQVDATDFYAAYHFYKPMNVMSGTFAEKGTSEKQRELQEKLNEFKVIFLFICYGPTVKVTYDPFSKGRNVQNGGLL